MEEEGRKKMEYVRIKVEAEVVEKMVPKILRDLFGGRDRDEYVFVMAPPKCKGALVGVGVGGLLIAQPTPVLSKITTPAVKEGKENV